MKIKNNKLTGRWEVIDLWFGVIEDFGTRQEARDYKQHITAGKI
jgi:hypothetical protein